MKELGVYFNPVARFEIRVKAFRLANETGNSIRQLTFPVEKLDENTDTFIVVGGDGSQKGFMEAVLARGDSQNTNILVAAGGSENGLYRAAGMSGAITSPEKILSGDFSDLREFHPGEISGEVFNHAVSFGKHAVNLEKYAGYFTGKVPRSVHTMAAAMTEIARGLKSDDVSGTLAKLITTGSNLGRLTLFKDLDLFDNRLGYASVEGGKRSEVTMRAIAACYYMARGLPFPERIATWEVVDSINLDLSPEDQMMNADGQIVRAASSKVSAVRSSKSVNLAAIKL